MRRRPANNIPIPPASGAFVGQIVGPVDALQNNAISALTTWGGYKQTLPTGGYTVSLAVYIDPLITPTDDARFVLAVAGSDPDTCRPTKPIYFRAGNQASNPEFFCLTILDSDPAGPPCDAPFVVQLARVVGSRGWYTFVAEFFANTETNQMTVRGYFLTPAGGQTAPQTFVVPGGYGGNHSAWFPFISGYDAVYIDNAVRTSGGVSPT
jgi:hypothetical protein